MSTDDTGRRPKVFEGDTERSSKARRHPRPVSSSIVESVIDDDVTPLPQEPPDISQLDGFDSLDPVLQRALMSINNTTREHDVTFAKLWGARHVHEEVADLRETIAELRPQFRYLANVRDSLDIHGKQLVQLVQWMDNARAFDAKLDRTLDALDRRLDTVEGDFREMKGTMAAFGKDIAEGFRRRDAELVEFKAAVEERFKKLEAEQAKKNEQYEARIRSLEDSRLSIKAQAAAVALLVGALWALITHFWK